MIKWFVLLFLSTAEGEDRAGGGGRASAGQSTNREETKCPPPGTVSTAERERK